eukprot:TRINITY_DN41737_c0_g1_i1.p1 TRINITY_DN41737_c0_g1~~TRINITY_DN41737_c0_g1_i1.p1  ORF type:complete len:772 (-),score=165.67 TRINITY_DN41737_c0_g1_i1:21-2336(-)
MGRLSSCILLLAVARQLARCEDPPGQKPWWEEEAGEAEAAAQAEGKHLPKRNTKPPPYDGYEFVNWDCVGIKDPIVDWDVAYQWVIDGLNGVFNFTEVDAAALPAEGEHSLYILPAPVMEALQTNTEKVRAECPLGFLYFVTLYTYHMFFTTNFANNAGVRQAEVLGEELKRYPFFVIAGARWPTYYALNSFSYIHRPQNDKAANVSLCTDVRGESGVDWAAVLEAAKGWATDQLAGHEPGAGDQEHGMALKAASDVVYKDPKGKGAIAQIECPFGFVFLCTTQVLAAAVRLTGAFEAWGRALDRILAELPYFSIAGSGWPTYSMLAFFSSLSKGTELPLMREFQADVHRWGGVHPNTKRFRQYGDLRLGKADLIGPWGLHPEGVAYVDTLSKHSVRDWLKDLMRQGVSRPRPVIMEALEAVSSVVQARGNPAYLECGFSGISEQMCADRGCAWVADAPSRSEAACRKKLPERKTVGVTFVWGEKWAPLVPLFVGWMVKLQVAVVMVAMGEACRNACEAAVAAHGGPIASGVACWDPLKGDDKLDKRRVDRGSILQRHAMVHLLLHMGVDAFAFDFDTFWFSDPRRFFEQTAQEHDADVLMVRHLDADCLNMGMLYIRASSRTASWYRKYLGWLHQHPYEREQRGANSLLNFTKQSVSFPPADRPPVKAVSLDDESEFSSSRGGWLGDWSKLKFFHWVNPRETTIQWSDIKVSDIKALYEAALDPGTNVGRSGGNLATLMVNAPRDSPLHLGKELMNSMRIDRTPERFECW